MHTNRLIGEKSPYLQQHAHNPIDWYPWGEEAFTAAKEQNKPIFLSIGYATCHWCHVMEEESFADPDVATALNEAFIAIKVDREELPEVDSLYMEFAQTMIVGSAGWPLNLLLTPELKPFFAATYLPTHSSRGLIGVIELTEKISHLWKSDEKDQLLDQAEKVVSILASHVHIEGNELPGDESIAQTSEILFKIADPIYGGMRGSPKFPLGYQTNFLLRCFQKFHDARALFLVEKTLEMMYRGGIRDHLGGGFHRYAVDEHWHIPHFEKMLYDNALLAYAYFEAWKVTGRALYVDAARQICDYVFEEMQHPDGGFYSAEDADSQGVEGLFYTWTRQEVKAILGEDVGALFCQLYGVFEHGIVEGRCGLRMSLSFEEFADQVGMEGKVLEEMMQKARLALYQNRKLRPRPFRDDKIITSWNGLMIHAFAEIGFSLHRQDYQQCALRAARFIKEQLWDGKRLYRRWRDGERRFVASLDDYAFLIRGLLSLYETALGNEWLSWAIELSNLLKQQYKAPRGAFYQAPPDDPYLVVRKCQYSDGAEPSGNAVHAENLLRLWQITGEKDYLIQAEDIFKASKRYLHTYPLGYCYHLIALQRYFDTHKATIEIALNSDREFEGEIKELLRKKRSAHHVVVWKAGVHPDKTTVSICYDGVCKAPATSFDAIVSALDLM
jgi:uncharacterized protein YyaL (SSP411 family)